jgi:hypothetical protein
MISVLAVIFQTATNGIREVTARAETLARQAPRWLNFFEVGKNVFIYNFKEFGEFHD